MNRHRFSAVIVSLLVSWSLSTCFAQQFSAVVPYFSIRSQSRDDARHVSGYFFKTFGETPCREIYGSFSMTPAFYKSFKNDRITRTLFEDLLNEDDALVISGSSVEDRGNADLLADYFYLPSDYQSTVSFNPQIDNFLIDLQFYLGLDGWIPGLYFFVYAPLVHTRWDMNICEHIIDDGIEPLSEGYFSPDQVNRSILLESFESYAAGDIVTGIPNIVLQRLASAKIRPSKVARTRFSDIIFAFGYRFIMEDDYGVGLNLQAAAPTGTRPRGEYLFEPTVGNGHHWEVGVGLHAHYRYRFGRAEQHALSLYTDINIATQFSAKQYRTFDLIHGGPLSRYMLVEQLGLPINDGLQTEDGTVPNAQFQSVFAPLANISTLPINAHSPVLADIVVAVNGEICNFSFDLGYNFWGISKEHVSILEATNLFINNKTWALKGDAHVFGFVESSSDYVALSATENLATIFSGTNATADTTLFVEQNPGIDHAELAYNAPASPLTFEQNVTAAGNEINTSVNPIFIDSSQLNIEGARTSGLSQKLFGHISYTWNDREPYKPYLGVGGEVEWSSFHNCGRCPLSQWGFWIKGGVSFE